MRKISPVVTLRYWPSYCLVAGLMVVVIELTGPSGPCSSSHQPINAPRRERERASTRHAYQGSEGTKGAERTERTQHSPRTENVEVVRKVVGAERHFVQVIHGVVDGLGRQRSHVAERAVRTEWAGVIEAPPLQETPMSVPLREREREREREMRLVHDSYMDVKNDAMSEHQSQPVEFNERVWLVPIGPQALRGPEGPRGPATPSGPDCRKNYTRRITYIEPRARPA